MEETDLSIEASTKQHKNQKSSSKNLKIEEERSKPKSIKLGIDEVELKNQALFNAAEDNKPSDLNQVSKDKIEKPKEVSSIRDITTFFAKKEKLSAPTLVIA